MKIKKIIRLFLALGIGSNIYAASVGDIAIVGISGDTSPTGTGNGKSIVFVALADIAEATQITFTDSGINADGTWRGNEGGAVYLAPTGGLAAGTVISASGTSASSWSGNTDFTGVASGTSLGNNGMNLSTSGDTVTAFTGDVATPTFLHMAASNSTQFLSTGSANSSSSYIASGLTLGTNAVAAGAGSGSGAEYDNVYYSGTITGSAVALFAAINDASNWTGSNSGFSPVTSFTVQAVPEPNTYALLAGMFALASVMLRRRSVK